MEIKLFVRTHKKGFGSTIYYSKNLKNDDKEKLESIKYTDYEPDMTEIIEITRKTYSIYFITFIGGKDEYGREYQSVISTIFPFQLSVNDLLNLKKMFNEIIADMLNDKFSIENKYFANIRGQLKHRYASMFANNEDMSTGKRVTGNIFFWLSICVFVLTCSLIILKYVSDKKEDVMFLKYKEFVQTIRKKGSYREKYRVYNQFLKEERDELNEVLKLAEQEEYKKIREFYNDNPEEIEKTLQLLEDYISKQENIINFEKFENFKLELLKKVEGAKSLDLYEKIQEYNSGPSLSKLLTIEKLSKKQLEKEEAQNIGLKKSIRKIEKIKNGLDVEFEIRVEGRNFLSSNKEIEFILQVENDKLYKKEKRIPKSKSDRDIYIGTYNGTIKLDSNVKLAVYELKVTGIKEKLFEINEKYENLKDNYLISAKNGKKYFKVKLWVYGNEFKLKF